jgi:uncharacterized protein (DUF1501 family)
MKRRDFLIGSGSVLAGLPLLLRAPEIFATSGQSVSNRLVVIMLNGGFDGLSAVTPIGDPKLFDQRPDLISHSNKEINPEFAITPALREFGGLLRSGKGSVIHACAFPYTKRSHFEGQNIVQTGSKTPFSMDTGWLGRALNQLGLSGRAISLDLPLMVRGDPKSDTLYPAKIPGVNDKNLVDTGSLAAMLAEQESGDLATSLQKLSDSANGGLLDLRRDRASLSYSIGQAMSQDDGPVASVVSVTGFDSHASQGTDRGIQDSHLSVVDEIIAGYRKGLGAKWDQTLVLTVTEFGRTVKMNGSWGTDHGYGSAMFLAGGLVTGGQVVADWPGLADKNLFEGRDLMATIDSRSVCCAALETVFEIPHEVSSKDIFVDSAIQNIKRYIPL